MCGFYCFFGDKSNNISTLQNKFLSHRGPDEFVQYQSNDFYAAFYRLSVVGLFDKHSQPFIGKNGTVVMVNGEIYNHLELIKKYNLNCNSHSDCEVVLHLYELLGIKKMLKCLDGEFSIVIYDNNKLYACRDKYGVKPLYYTENGKELSSLVNGIQSKDDEIFHIIPGYLYTFDKISEIKEKIEYYCENLQFPITKEDIYNSLVKSVEKRIIHSDRPVGFLLSGGLDSSIVLSIALNSGLLKKPAHVFTFGFDKNAPDVLGAEKIIKFLKNKHGDDSLIWHLVLMTPDDGLKNLEDLIVILETYDTTTIRASTPMYLLCKYIKETTDITVILSGEGSDEAGAGYLYTKYAPNDIELQEDCQKLLDELYLFDCLRADRTSASNSLEIRPPFLDFSFTELVKKSELLKCNSETTKFLFRSMIPDNMLISDIQWGMKVAFSDGVSDIWKIELKKFTDIFVHKTKHLIYNPNLIPETNEGKVFQHIFATHFGINKWNLLPKLWLPNLKWMENYGIKIGQEPSATILPEYYNKKN